MQKNSLDKIENKHKCFGNLKETELLNYPRDFTKIIDNTNKYLSEIKNKKYKYTLNELCELLEITALYANRYFTDKLDTIYITRTCKLYTYAMNSKDTKQIKEFAKLFKKEDIANVCSQILFTNNEDFKQKLIDLNLNKNRLLKKYFITEDSIKSAIKEVFKKEIRTRIEAGEEEVISTEYKELDDTLINEIIRKGLVSTNTLKEKFNVKTDTQFHRILYRFEELENLRLAIENNNDNKHNTIRYINDIEIINKIKITLENEKKDNEEFAKERYNRERNIY